ncbi:MAG: methyltransferase [Deltaproteobacteria bacterium]|nr:methyltransferase [Deltaproteobacteria bacterium]
MTPKERALNTILGKPIDHMGLFTGMGCVTMPGLKKLGYKFATVHTDAERLARAAFSTCEMFGMESCVVPFDMAIESEAIGNTISLYEDSEDILYPTIPHKIWKTMDDLAIPDDVHERGRFPMLFESVKILKGLTGDQFAAGGWSLGPFTQAGQMLELDLILKGVFREKAKVEKVLDAITDMAIETGRRLKASGVDFLTLREPGVAADLLSPRTFKQLIQPRLTKILEGWGDIPKVLHICGTATPLVEMMMDCGAHALSFDVKTDLAVAREKMGKIPILGNYEVFYIPCQNPVEDAEKAMQACIDAGVDGVWPGCDLWPDVKEENLQMMRKTVTEYGAKASPAVGRI